MALKISGQEKKIGETEQLCQDKTKQLSKAEQEIKSLADKNSEKDKLLMDLKASKESLF